MKKYLVLSAVLLGAVASSHAGGIDFRFRLPLPPLPHIVIGQPAPRVVVRAPEVCLPPPPVVYVPAPYCPPPVVYHRPPVVYGRYAYSSHDRGHDWQDRRGGNDRYERHDSYDRRDRR
jgi:hypothetical protein